jgi:hypothetical protein
MVVMVVKKYFGGLTTHFQVQKYMSQCCNKRYFIFSRGTYFHATMSDAWEEIQAIKSKRNSLREKLQKRKKQRQDILNQSGGALTSGL